MRTVSRTARGADARDPAGGRAVSPARRVAEWLLLVFAICTLAVALVGTGSDDVFAGSSGATATASGISTLGPLAANAPNNRLGTAALDLGAGDAAQRVVDVTNTSRRALRAVMLRTIASPSSRLDTDRVNGLHLVLDRCSVPWTESGGPGTGRPYAYACRATTTVVLGSRPVVIGETALPALALGPGAHNYLRATLVLAGSVPALEGQFSTIHYTFRAVT